MRGIYAGGSTCQVFSSFTVVGGACAVGWRQFARWGDVDGAYFCCLVAGAAAGAANLLRFLQDLPQMRGSSVLARELSANQLQTVSALLRATGRCARTLRIRTAPLRVWAATLRARGCNPARPGCSPTCVVHRCAPSTGALGCWLRVTSCGSATASRAS